MSVLLCPWCGGELPGEPGQFVKCRHCASDIYWGDNKPWRTKMQAANASQVHPTELSPAVEDTTPTPSESDFVPSDPLPPPVPLVVDGGLQHLPLSWVEKRRLKSIARKREEAEARRRLEDGYFGNSDYGDLGDWWLAYRSTIKTAYVAFVALMLLIGVGYASVPGGDSAFLTGVAIFSLLSIPYGFMWSVGISTAPKSVRIIGGLFWVFIITLYLCFFGFLVYELWKSLPT